MTLVPSHLLPPHSASSSMVATKHLSFMVEVKDLVYRKSMLYSQICTEGTPLVRKGTPCDLKLGLLILGKGLHGQVGTDAISTDAWAGMRWYGTCVVRDTSCRERVLQGTRSIQNASCTSTGRVPDGMRPVQDTSIRSSRCRPEQDRTVLIDLHRTRAP